MANAQELYNQALKAIEAGEKQAAMELLRQAVEQDNFNLYAWLKLAEIMPDVEEKYGVLEQVLQLDPNNEFANSEWDRLNQLAESGRLGEISDDESFDAADEAADNVSSPAAGFSLPTGQRIKLPVAQAQKVMAQLEKLSGIDFEEELVPGITNRIAAYVGAGLFVFTLIMCFLTFSVINGANNRVAANRARATADVIEQTEALIAIGEGITQTFAVGTQVASDLTATAAATITPSVTPRPAGGLVSATEIPPTVTATEPTFRIYPMPPSNLPGTLLAWGDLNPASQRFLYLFTYDPRTGSRFKVNDETVTSPSIDNFGIRIAYLRFNPRDNSELVYVIDAKDRTATPINMNLVFGGDVLDPHSPSLSANGNHLVFLGRADTGTDEVFLWNFLEKKLTQVTRDGSNYTAVAVSATGSQIVAVKQDAVGIDLVLVNVADIISPDVPVPQTLLTNDRNAIIESSPAFSTDGRLLIYSAAAAPRNGDIVTLDLESLTVTTVIATTADEITPHFSPDSRFIVYSANPTGAYNLFIFDTISQSTFQLTEEQRDPIYAAGWFN